MEDTGLPMLLRDSQVLPIWEGTTNVLSLDVLRALGDGGPLAALQEKVTRCLQAVNETSLVEAGGMAQTAVAHAASWLKQTKPRGREALEAGARRFALTLGRSLALALLWNMLNGLWIMNKIVVPWPPLAALPSSQLIWWWMCWRVMPLPWQLGKD